MDMGKDFIFNYQKSIVMCKSLFCENLPLKLLTVVALIIVCVDLQVLKQTF